MINYGRDLAYIHHAGFRDFALKAAPEIIRILHTHKIHHGLVIDLGCGSGVLARELLNARYDVLGIDQSAAMIRMARQNAPGAKFIRGSIYQLKLPDCAAVVSTGECLNYTFESNSLRILSKLFRRIGQVLQPHGIFVFDLLNPDQPSRTVIRSGDGWDIFSESAVDLRTSILTRKTIYFRKSANGLYRRSQEIHRQKLYAPERIRHELIVAGCSVRILKGYGKFKLPHHDVFIAKKVMSNE